MKSKHKAFRIFVGFTVAGGIGALVTVPEGWHEVGVYPLVAASLAALVLATELVPVTLPYRRATVEVATSTTFVVALLLFAGIGPALVAQLLGSLVADLVHRKALVKTVFNLAQFAIALAASGTVLVKMGGASALTDGVVGRAEIAPMLAAFAVFLAINNGMVWVVVSLATHSSFRRRLADEWVFTTVSGLVLVGLSPVVDLVAVKALGMLPLLLIPVGAVYVTARSSLAQAHQALHDSLTGLPNRACFRGHVVAALEEPGRMRRPLALMLIDLNNFREINDTLGHDTGDVLLRKVGPRLAAASEAVTLVARFGGDEFAVLLAEVEGPEGATEVARMLTRVLEEPFILEDGLWLELEASIGIAVTPEHGGDVDVLLQRADIAMYQAKAAKTGVGLYAPERDDNSRRRLMLIGQLRSAIANDELVLFYQPKLNLATHQFSGVEALVRWFHPELGSIAPDEFIPLAERSGLIKPLTRFVLETGISQAQRWHRDGLALRVAVNLSARTFLDSELPSTVASLLEKFGMDPSWLELEITETELMWDPARGAKVLGRLHAMGIRLTIDDFGTGYSSLAYLGSLPVDEIKVDRSFVAAMASGGPSTDDIIVRSTIDLAHNLGLEVTAEGVETVDQVERLTDLGCDFLQGFYLSRPLPAAELFTLLAATSALALRRPGRSSPE